MKTILMFSENIFPVMDKQEPVKRHFYRWRRIREEYRMASSRDFFSNPEPVSVHGSMKWPRYESLERPKYLSLPIFTINII